MLFKASTGVKRCKGEAITEALTANAVVTGIHPEASPSISRYPWGLHDDVEGWLASPDGSIDLAIRPLTRGHGVASEAVGQAHE